MATATAQSRSILLSTPHTNYHVSSPFISSSSSSSTASLSGFTTPTTPVYKQSQVYPPPSRKIRFAPLPDPRRAVLITDDGGELPIPNGEDANQIPAPLSLAPAVPTIDIQTQDTSSLSSFGSSKRNSDTDPSTTSTTPGTATPASTQSDYDSSRPASPNGLSPATPVSPLPTPKPAVPANQSSGWPKSKGLSIFKSFKRSSGSSSSSSHSLTPTPSIDRASNATVGRKGITTEEILTLGTINLFRASSRDSSKSSDSTAGWSLTRWASTGGGSGVPIKQFGVPLHRTQSTQSTQSYQSKTPSLLSGFRPSSAPAKSTAAPNRKGTRMLNGRVYGQKRNPNTTNLFANAPDAEPEFVEWGYGGMGSVKGARSAGAGSQWERLHGGVAVEDDEDDGTSMAWLKKRREAREKKAREEQEAREKAENESAEAAVAPAETSVETSVEPLDGDENGGPPNLVSTPSFISESAMPTPRPSSPDMNVSPINFAAKASSISVNTHHSNSTAVPASPTIPHSPSRELSSPQPSHLLSAEEAHVFTTMAIPMSRPHHHHRPRSNTRDGRDGPILPLAISTDAEKEQVIPDTEVVTNGNDSGTDSESDAETDSELDDEDSSDDEDSDDADAEAEARRKMVIGAGLEKVSRHRMEMEEQNHF
ncbi:hypothetical protein FA15DRAFT_667548 [Coprinopsis marcescibilis]|uniref:Uncharacterized protein n=1 Tax=Coprinopsis marcescibilis TaxID=230819 RepID=A0A5C3L0G1_COPMA|nr:hypothetical protein FA15DRAFT_667548 [Coprinopsis marcescibilis]